ncbi:MAG: type II toxin-antitoxin system Phd/YefM family antitoxin [Oscillospiraceae bacterium]|nr:type II toxin-antitoxin system Phd/YefM family antitoxin [Oscillospiraceae bacterium]
MTEANQNFSRVVRMVDENGMAVILKNNKPRYMVMNFSEYDEIQTARRKFFNSTADSIISENLEALKELAK